MPGPVRDPDTTEDTADRSTTSPADGAVYRADDVAAAVLEKPGRWVLLVEDQRIVDDLWQRGFTSTTAGGEVLRGARVVLLPDCTAAGFRWARKVADQLRGVAAAVHLLALWSEAQAEGGGPSEWLICGHTVSELKDRINKAPTVAAFLALEDHVPDAPGSNGNGAAAVPTDPPDSRPAPRGTRRALIIEARTVVPVQTRWLWLRRIPLGKLTMLTGDADLGKSTMTCDIAARVSRGDVMPDGTPGLGVPAGVVMIGIEDDRDDTIVPRLIAAGADLDHIAFVSAEDVEGWEEPLTLPDDVPILREAIARKAAQLVIVDPVVAFIGLKTDTYNDQQVRRAMGPCIILARNGGLAVLAVSHPSRSRGAGNPLHFSGGSLGFVNASRSALMVAKDPDDATRSILARVKGNLTKAPPSIAYRITGPDDGVGHIEWLGTSEQTAESLLSIKPEGGVSPAVQRAVDILEELMAPGDTRLADDGLKKAAKVGISEPSLRRARGLLGIEAKKDGLFGGWVWRWPGGAE